MSNNLAEAIERLRDSRSQLDAVITNFEEIRDSITSITYGPDQSEDQKPVAIQVDEKPSRKDVRAKKSNGKTGEKKTIIGAAVEVIRENGPSRTPFILDALKRAKFKVGGKKPIVTLYSILARSPRVSRTAGGAWGVIEKQ